MFSRVTVISRFKIYLLEPTELKPWKLQELSSHGLTLQVRAHDLRLRAQRSAHVYGLPHGHGVHRCPAIVDPKAMRFESFKVPVTIS